MSSPEFRRVDARDFRLGPGNLVRAGNVLVSHSELSNDKTTQIGISNAIDALEEGGLLILDAHRTDLDIVFSAARLTQEFELSTFIVPVSKSQYDSKKYGGKLKKIAETVIGSELYPVVRAEESGKTNREDLHLEDITPEEKNRLNRRYFIRAGQVIKSPHCAAIVAPYGSRHTYRQEVRKGVINLIRRGSPVIFTMSERVPKKKILGIVKRFPYHRLYVSKVISFSRDSSDKYINTFVDAQFGDLERRAVIR